MVHWIQSNPKTIIKQLRYYPCQQRTANLKTRVCVALYQVHLKRLVDHKVVAEDLERVAYTQRVNLVVDCAETVHHEPLHARKQVAHETNVFVLVIAVQEPLKVVDAQLVGVLVLAVVVSVGLHSVIGQVHKSVAEILEVKRLRASAEVYVAVHVASEETVDGGKHSEGTDVEFSAADEKWSVDVELYDTRLFVFDDVFDLMKIRADFNPRTSIGIFTWFNDPNVCLLFKYFSECGFLVS